LTDTHYRKFAYPQLQIFRSVYVDWFVCQKLWKLESRWRYCNNKRVQFLAHPVHPRSGHWHQNLGSDIIIQKSFRSTEVATCTSLSVKLGLIIKRRNAFFGHANSKTVLRHMMTNPYIRNSNVRLMYHLGYSLIASKTPFWSPWKQVTAPDTT